MVTVLIYQELCRPTIILFRFCVTTGAQLGTIISLLLSAVLCHYTDWQVVFYTIGKSLIISSLSICSDERLAKTRSHPEMVGDMSRVTVNLHAPTLPAPIDTFYVKNKERFWLKFVCLRQVC